MTRPVIGSEYKVATWDGNVLPSMSENNIPKDVEITFACEVSAWGDNLKSCYCCWCGKEIVHAGSGFVSQIFDGNIVMLDTCQEHKKPMLKFIQDNHNILAPWFVYVVKEAKFDKTRRNFTNA